MSADGVPIFCPLCEADIGPVFPGNEGEFPRVVHEPDGSHFFVWPGHDEDEVRLARG